MAGTCKESTFSVLPVVRREYECEYAYHHVGKICVVPPLSFLLLNYSFSHHRHLRGDNCMLLAHRP